MEVGKASGDGWLLSRPSYMIIRPSPTHPTHPVPDSTLPTLPPPPPHFPTPPFNPTPSSTGRLVVLPLPHLGFLHILGAWSIHEPACYTWLHTCDLRFGLPRRWACPGRVAPKTRDSAVKLANHSVHPESLPESSSALPHAFLSPQSTTDRKPAIALDTLGRRL